MDIKSFILGLQKGKSMGGGSSADVRYVTFIGADGAVLYKKPVAVGDDCVDVLTKGLISTPTKESTVAETYTYSGWALTEDGAASADALKNVTEDRTVYAAFKASVIYYTVNFYDDDGVTLLSSKQVTYGADALYTPQKSGYKFVSWSADVSNVTGNIDVVAVWQVDDGYIHDSWETVVARCLDGTAATYYSLGNKIKLPLQYADGTTEDIDMFLATFGAHGGELADGSTIHATFTSANPLAQSMKLSDNYAMRNTKTADLVPIKHLADNVLPAMPAVLQENIKERAYPQQLSDTSTTPLKLWMIGYWESYSYAFCQARHIKVGHVYCASGEIWGPAVMKPLYKNGASEASDWWLSGAITSGANKYPYYINADGTYTETSTNDAGAQARGIVFGFCI